MKKQEEKLIFSPDFRPFNPEIETKCEYEMNAVFPIFVIDSDIKEIAADKNKEQISKDKGDSAIVGDIGD